MKALKLYRTASALVLGGLIAVVATKAIHAIENESEAPPYQLTDSNSLYGSYLAGRLARTERDNQTAAGYYSEALEKDPDSKEILEDAFQLKVATGAFPEALDLGRQLLTRDNQHKIANFLLGATAFSKKNYGDAEKYFKTGGKGPIADLTGNLARNWIDLARGRINEALKAPSAPMPQTEAIELLHRAMIADIAKRRNVARAAYEQLHAKSSRSVRTIEAYARHAAFWGDKDLALEILKPGLTTPNPNPLLKAIANDLAAGRPVALLVSTPQEGLAEVFQDIGEALASDNVYEAGQIYLQLALFVRPDFPVAQYALGELYDQLKNYELAAASFALIPREASLWAVAQLRRTLDMSALNRIDEAKAILTELIKAYPDDMRPHYTMGNLLRANKEYAEAIVYYSNAIEKLGTPDKSHWAFYYARGICYERTKSWPKAEADLKKALELDNTQELALNYLGYSWVDQATNLQEGMELIKRAVKLRPQDGYFVDSLGWAYFRQQDYTQAVKYLEHAVELRPDDPTINDHLGDAYWHVDRKLEAQFQWKQALDLKPDPEDAAKIKKKLEEGVSETPSTRASLEPPAASGQPQTEAK
jgi:tetratricopeptide (TPR) repeat protein